MPVPKSWGDGPLEVVLQLARLAVLDVTGDAYRADAKVHFIIVSFCLN